MLSIKPDFVHVAEVNPPVLPDMSHLMLDGAWQNILVTDNVFGKIRVSPYAYAARITHDVPSVHPTVVVSTRDRNILAIESEVRGALGNGVNSFLVVTGDTMPAVEHLANHYEIVEHLRNLQAQMPAFEVGMAARFRRWQLQRRIEAGAQFFVVGPVLDPAHVEPNLGRLELSGDEPPVYLMVMPPFSNRWVDRIEALGGGEASPELREQLAALEGEARRDFAWQQAAEATARARDAGAAGVILMGLKFDTVVDEAAAEWRQQFGKV